MPRVPTYDEFQAAPQVAPAARAENPVTPQMMSVAGEQIQQLGRGMQSIGNAGAQIMIDVQKDINEAATREADNAFANDSNRVLTDYMNRTGKDAVVSQEDVQKAILESANSAGGALQNDMQRRMYHDVVSRRLQQTMGQVNMHAATQAKQWNIKETEARIANASDTASKSWSSWQDDFGDLRHTDYDPEKFGNRPDGSKKGTGFLGVLKGADGSAMTEYSVGVNINGKEMDVPTLVPTLTRAEVKTVLNLKEGEKLPDTIIQKAVDHAKQRIADGKSVFAQDGEGPQQQSTPFTTNKNTMLADVNALVKLSMGADPDSEIAKQARMAYTTDLTSKTVQNMLVGNQSRMASDYLESAIGRGEVDPAKVKPLSDMVRSANVSDEAVRLSRSLTGGFESKMSQLEKLHESGKISVEVFEKARSEVEHKWTVQKAQESEHEKTIIGNATDWAIHNTGSSIVDFQKANPAVYEYMKVHGRLAELNTVIKSNGKIDNDPVTWAQVMTDQQSLKDLTPTQIYNKYSMKLDEPHLEKLYSINAALNGSKDDNHLTVLSNTEMIKNSAQSLGILPYKGTPSESQSKDFDAFTRALDARVAAYEQNELKGKKAGQQDLKKILQEIELDRVYKSRTAWTDKSDVPMVTMKPEDFEKAYVKVGEEEIFLATIPATQRALIIPALRKAGKPITEQNIADYWVRNGKTK